MSVQIRNHRKMYGYGYALIIDNKAIGRNGEAIQMPEHGGIPCHAACFVSISSLKIFWKLYRHRILYNVQHNVMLSVWGSLIPSRSN